MHWSDGVVASGGGIDGEAKECASIELVVVADQVWIGREWF